MPDSIVKYLYRKNFICVRGFCGDKIETHLTNEHTLVVFTCITPASAKNIFDYHISFRPGDTPNITTPMPHAKCLVCLTQLIELGFNRTLVHHNNKYNGRGKARQRLQYVRNIHV
jgi:hypothetical protein